MVDASAHAAGAFQGAERMAAAAALCLPVCGQSMCRVPRWRTVSWRRPSTSSTSRATTATSSQLPAASSLSSRPGRHCHMSCCTMCRAISCRSQPVCRAGMIILRDLAREYLKPLYAHFGGKPKAFALFILSSFDRAPILADPDGFPDLSRRRSKSCRNARPDLCVAVKPHPATSPTYRAIIADIIAARQAEARRWRNSSASCC